MYIRAHSCFITVVDISELGLVYAFQVPKTMKMNAMAAMGATMVIIKGVGINIDMLFLNFACMQLVTTVSHHFDFDALADSSVLQINF